MNIIKSIHINHKNKKNHHKTDHDKDYNTSTWKFLIDP